MTRLARVTWPGLSLDVHKGDIILLRGPNGCGKTSLLRALAGLSSPLPFRLEEAAQVGYSPQDARDALVGLTVAGEFRLRARGVPEPLARLGERASVELSSGETRRVVLAIAKGAPLLLLDEASEGLDGAGRAALRGLVAEASRRGAVVMAEHGRALEGLATRAVDLAAARGGPLPPMPRGEGAVVVQAEAAHVRGVALPFLALGPGFHVLRGPNGSGKSTLLRRLAGLLAPEGVRVLGAPPRPGESARLLLPHARDLLMRERVADECPVDPLVPGALRARHPLTLSGGEAQRVALAKTLARDAPLYLLDEPEAHLDAAGRALLAEAIAARVKGGACVLAATHDDALAGLAQSVMELAP